MGVYIIISWNGSIQSVPWIQFHFFRFSFCDKIGRNLNYAFMNLIEFLCFDLHSCTWFGHRQWHEFERACEVLNHQQKYQLFKTLSLELNHSELAVFLFLFRPKLEICFFPQNLSQTIHVLGNSYPINEYRLEYSKYKKFTCQVKKLSIEVTFFTLLTRTKCKE